MASAKNKVDGSIKKQIMDFLQKLQVDDTAPGLHIEPMVKPRDPRVRTGRVNDSCRAVLYKMDVEGEPHYVYYGTWPHDEAIKVARSTVLKLNLALGAPEFKDQGLPESSAEPSRQTDYYTHEPESPAEPAATAEHHGAQPWENQLPGNWDKERLASEAGIEPGAARAAMAATTQGQLTRILNALPEAQGLVLLGLANGEDLSDIREELGLVPATGDHGESEQLDRALRESRAGFVFVGDNPQELRDALESMDIDRWRVFLHPEQRKYVQGRWGGSYRLSGGAGTGKTVVLVHRARSLFRENPATRILLTTYTRTLAAALENQLAKLDPSIPQVAMGETGVSVKGMDQIAAQVIREATADELKSAAATVLGEARNLMTHRAAKIGADLRTAVELANPELPEELLEAAFLEQEYVSIVLANSVTEEKEYLRVSRQGRGTALNRKARQEVWKVFAQFRRTHQMNDAISFPEAAAVAAAVLRHRLDAGGQLPFEHVLVDEAQDFHAGHWLLLRALVAEGPDDLFIAEDSHQRIYGQKVPLTRFGIQIRGRSRRLRLNYRTTAENLSYAMSILAGGDYTDIEDTPETSGDYRSVRSGPVPVVLQAADSHGELEAAIGQLDQWLGRNADPSGIAVLVRSEPRIQTVTAALNEAKLPNSAVRGGGTAGAGKITVMTMHSAKGMEFERVIVLGAGAKDIPATWSYERLPEAEQLDARLREQSLLYVAATRARDELVLTTS